ncbi:MAG: hypothetical protein HGA85_09245 [Nanoarchaeota archaeon]|nr:hypothetical protein [Nanoarchaeota archaeon]
MPHQCVRCGYIYEDSTNGIIVSGCKCGGKLFFFVKKEKLEEMKKAQFKLSNEDKAKIESDVFDIIGVDKTEEPVVLDFESIRVLKPGKYELDLVNLFKDRPLIYKLDEGKYMIDLPESFKKAFRK